MDALQLKILQNLLRTTEKVPPQHRLEEIQMGPTTSYGLYLQEGNKEEAAIIKPVLDVVMRATSVKELEQMVSISAAPTPTPPIKKQP